MALGRVLCLVNSFSVIVIKCHDEGNLHEKDFIIVNRSRGIRVHFGWVGEA